MSKTNKVVFLKSAVKPEDFPMADRPEVMLAGRSNAGKSSFLNALSGSSVAKVSQSPGKTRLLNFFDVGKNYRILDAPGYGFSKRSGDEQSSWQEMIEDYMATRSHFVGMVLIMDIRRDWSSDERSLLHWVQGLGRPTMLVLTKADQLRPSEVKVRVSKIQKDSGLRLICYCTTQGKEGRDQVLEIEDLFFREWIKNVGK